MVQVFLGDDKNILQLDTNSTTVNILKTTELYRLIRVNFMACELYLNKAVIKKQCHNSPPFGLL